MPIMNDDGQLNAKDSLAVKRKITPANITILKKEGMVKTAPFLAGFNYT